MKTETEATL